jgi:DmsE family decaheme c-type cytochrome
MLRSTFFQVYLACFFSSVFVLGSAEVFALEKTVPCSACHAETSQAFTAEAHGRAFARGELAERPDAQCAACHGDGQAHVSAPTDASAMRTFRDEPAAEVNTSCGSCHTDTHPSKVNAHAGLACTSCHSVHHDPARPLLPHALRDLDASSTACYACHEDTFVEFRFNESHRLAEGAVSCVSCHDPHAPSAGMRLGGFQQSVCRKCHADKDGPFVFEHAATRVEGCTACHTPHGSANRHMLTHQNNGALCYSCHAAVPQFHLGFGPGPARFNERTVCTNCHVTIHGSNLDRDFLR